MTFRIVCRPDLPASQSHYRILDDQEREIEWVNRFLDVQQVRGLSPLTLRGYANALLPFVRWWSRQPGVDVQCLRKDDFNESTLLDYVCSQLNQPVRPSPENVNSRSQMLRRLFQFHFGQKLPQSPYLVRRKWRHQSSLGYGGKHLVFSTDLKLKAPQRVIMPLSREQVEHFWGSFRAARDLAIVGLMLLNGLRSREVLALTLEDLLFSEAQIRVRGKGGRVRLMPLAPETIGNLKCYLTTERPLTNVPQVFVCLKGRARGTPMTAAGLRSLFRHHRRTSGVKQANPHRFRHNFGSDMIRAGVSLPSLMRLMGHAYIHTTLVYVQLTSQDVFAEYARAVEQITRRKQSQ